MNADQRLDQLEPMLSEAMAILDRHTAQLKQLGAAVGQLIEVTTLQSNNISFILREQVIMKADIAELKTDVAELKAGQAELKAGQAELKAGQAELKASQAEMQASQAEMQAEQVSINTKLDLILSKL